MRRRRAALSTWWSGVQRHSRLKGAVLGCLGVMFVLVIALITTVQALSTRAEADLLQIEEWSTAASDAGTVSVLLESWTGTNDSARADLIAALGELVADVAAADPDGETLASRELAALVDDVQVLLDAPAGLRSTFAGEMQALAGPFALIAEDLAETGRSETRSTIASLERVFTAMQIVAGTAAVVFLVVVLTQILPLTRSIQRSMSKLQNWNEIADREGRRRRLSQQVIDGLEVAVDEPAAYAVIKRALGTATPDATAEMLLADSSQAHLRAAVVHPHNGGAGCGVVSPWSCPAVRRGTTQTFDDSEAIRACPHLSRHAEPCSAVCAPMTFMGEPMGVLHVTGPVGEKPSDELVNDVSMIASESATRVGTLRAFARAELQAATDVLTGLPNRRATEERLRTLLSTADGGSAAVIEIVGVAGLNDQLGKSAGDRALKVASEALTQAMRADDWCGRWAGAEFVVILPGESASAAREIVERVCDHVGEMLTAADMASLETSVGIADTRRARTAHGMMGLIGEALSDARDDGAASDSEPEEILSDPQLSTP